MHIKIVKQKDIFGHNKNNISNGDDDDDIDNGRICKTVKITSMYY